MGYWLANNLNRQRMSKKDREHTVNELERNIRIEQEERLWVPPVIENSGLIYTVL